ncbi:hypothetical protein CROQUDRAFT_649745 [Cronartium quercuum f. sp. fusiforme G11]|uniref:ATP adenylyltransferase n=1 Tax=Cronartium quercuum f. sp. fusiforme G11 TaxID=708437 RepID=A0A9P6NU84_9BASI|nr:hypothetical protein CROQUDRAFT_649745 [Cronartium quercuum f. sp. fusiforme G11]
MRFPNFITSLQARHERALESNHLVFIPTQIFHLNSKAGVRCEIRFAPSLAKKSVSSPSKQSSLDLDPFAPPYIPELFICQSEDCEKEDGYVVLLNKFCVVPRHFLLVTSAYRPQATPPAPEDLFAIYSLLRQAQTLDPNSEWISFFNCGPHSGASQPHKHFQFIPVEMGGNPFGELLVRSAPPKIGDVYNVSEIGYAHFACAIPPELGIKIGDDETEATLGKLFMTMLDSMIDHLRHLPFEEGSPSPSIGSQGLSYNLVMTTRYMLLVPRSREKFLAQGLSINSLGVGTGMVLVKTEAELEEAQRVGIDEVLLGVTFPILKDVINPCDHG